jgi:hypothetical protein
MTTTAPQPDAPEAISAGPAVAPVPAIPPRPAGLTPIKIRFHALAVTRHGRRSRLCENQIVAESKINASSG